MKEQKKGVSFAFFLITLFSFLLYFSASATAQISVQKGTFLEMAKKFIQTNQKKADFLQDCQLGEPELYRDLKTGEKNWRIKIVKSDELIGYFYASGKTLKDGNIMTWFAGTGGSEGKIASKTNKNQKNYTPLPQNKGEFSGKGPSKKLQEALDKHSKKYSLNPGEIIPKDVRTPKIGPSELIFDPTKYKKVKPPKDFNKTESNYDNVPDAPMGWQTIKYEGFEGSFPNDWNVFANSGYADAYWDDTSYKSYNGSWSAFCADEGSEGTGYGGQYVNNMSSWMIYGPFSLADANNAVVEFGHWTKTETNWDKFHYVASIDGVHYYGWYLTGNMTDDPGNVNGWLTQTFDLTNVYQIGDITGQSQVWIAFVFTSDGSIVDNGTYVDEVYIKKYVGGSETPTLIEHFTCSDGDDPYNTQTNTFSTTDNIATEFTRWNSSSCTSDHSLSIKFYDTSNSLYWQATQTIPAGQSSWTYWAGIYISGHQPANEPGTWKAKVFVDNNLVVTDTFTIQEQGGEPTVTEHFMCRDGDNPYTTRTDTFYTNDAIATNFMVWNTSTCTRDWTANCSFFDTGDNYYAGLDFTLEMGHASLTHWVGIYVSGHQPANEPGHWRARVRLEGTFMYREDFYIVVPGSQDPDIFVQPTSLEIHQTPGFSPNDSHQDENLALPAGGRHPRGLKIPDYVREYWKTNKPNLQYDPSTLLSSIDWSANDSPVKNQGNCGSCWAFAAIALVENIGVWNDLSEQEIVSCAQGDCGGGWYWDALQYIHDNGVSPESCFPYTATNNNCNNRCSNPEYLAKITDYTPAQGLWGEPANVNDIKAQLQNGPLAVAMLVPDDGTFDNYSGGVYNYNGGAISWDNGHAVLVVGYDDNGQYFKAKNSWGSNWGENGYFRISYDDVTDDVHFGMYACTASGPYQEGGNTGNTFIIQNNGNANLIINSITDNKSWLSFTPTTIPTLVPGASQTVTVNIDNWAAVNCPSETGVITINSNDPDESVVEVNVLAVPNCNTNPVLQVNPTSLTFSSNQGSNPPSQTFGISNGGTGSFTWTVSDNKNWIQCSPTSGSVTNETDNVTVSISSTGLTPGQTYTGTITVTAAGASGSPKTVNVTFNYGGNEPCNPPYVKAEDASGAQGSDVIVDIELSGNPNPVDAFGFKFTFDPSKLTFVSVSKGNLTNEFDFFNGQEGPAGTVTIGGFDTSPILANSTGKIARVTLHVSQCSQGETVTLGIQNLTDDLSGMNACPGTFTCQACLLGDVNNDGSISPGDALCAFQIYLNGGSLPSGDCNNECALYAADVNCTPNGITPGDALYIFMGYLNGESAPLDCDPTFNLGNYLTSTKTISLVQAQPSLQDEIKLAVQVNNVHELQAFGLNIGFPDDLLKLVDVEATDFTETWQMFDGKESIPGIVIVGAIGEEKTKEASAGQLAILTFRVLRPAEKAELWIYGLTDDLRDYEVTAEKYVLPLVKSSVENLSANELPEEYNLEQNFPNPFNQETEIRYDLPEAVHVNLAIYNAMGQKVRTIVSTRQEAGKYRAHWDGKNDSGDDLPSGVYVYKLIAGDFALSKKLVLIK